MFTDIKIYPINNKTYHISEKYIFIEKKSKKYFLDFRSDLEQDPDPDPLFHETKRQLKDMLCFYMTNDIITFPILHFGCIVLNYKQNNHFLNRLQLGQSLMNSFERRSFCIK